MCGFAEAALVVSTVTGAASAAQDYRVGKANAAMARQEAQQTREIGQIQEQSARSRMAALIARQSGQLVARGVSLDSVTAQDLGDDAAKTRSAEAGTARFNANSRSRALTHEAKILEAQGVSDALTGIARTGAKALGRSAQLWPGLVGA